MICGTVSMLNFAVGQLLTSDDIVYVCVKRTRKCEDLIEDVDKCASRSCELRVVVWMNGGSKLERLL